MHGAGGLGARPPRPLRSRRKDFRPDRFRMSTKDIRTSHAHTVCDVCGRTLLRGERAETYINGGARRSVCELCKSRALQEGWVREGTLPAYDRDEAGADRRGRSLLGRFRTRREDGRRASSAGPPAEEFSASGWSPPVPAAPAGDERGAPPPVPAAPREEPRRPPLGPGKPREPRHVRAVPTSDEQKVMAAVELFNQSEHRRTISGVARSLGAPEVSVAPIADHPSLVQVVASWELCWYRYVVDLSEEVPGVRLDGQGYELSELTERERQADAMADEAGQLTLTSP